jgi:putative hemolysin
MVRNDHNSQQDQIGLPRINKIYSDALNQISNDQRLYENHNRVQEILNRMKDAEKRKYQHNRPTWWG